MPPFGKLALFDTLVLAARRFLGLFSFGLSRAVYDELKQEQFLQLLEGRIKQHDKDIERMCNHHYQGFIESVNELLKVGADARRLKVCVCCVNLNTMEPYRYRRW